MRRFADLYAALDRTTRTNEKVAAIADHLRAAPPEDAAWAVYFLSGRRLQGLLASSSLAGLAAQAAGVPGWLLLESLTAVGDFTETIALLLDTRAR
ncbi:ATP-dependent DNA ligase, partial [bacterium]|nr:ATP-dependent DNA ligase [bacterium]